MQDWVGHWHGFGPWTGPADALRQEGLRRPGSHPDDEHTRAFLANPMPPVMTGHYLLRHDQAAAERTWVDVGDALAWLERVHDAHPPDLSGGVGPSVPVRLSMAADTLMRGTDVVWAYYNPRFTFVSYSVICCPNRMHPDVRCPVPVRREVRVPASTP